MLTTVVNARESERFHVSLKMKANFDVPVITTELLNQKFKDNGNKKSVCVLLCTLHKR